MDTRQATEHYLDELRMGDEDAWFRLIEADDATIPSLMDAFRREAQSDMKARILEIIWQHGLPETIPLLAEALESSESQVWKTALDGLVTIGGSASKSAIRLALVSHADNPELCEWATQALEQFV